MKKKDPLSIESVIATVLDSHAWQMREIAANVATGEVKAGWDAAADWLEKAAAHYRVPSNA